MPTKKDIQVILTTPTIQKDLKVAVPMFPNTDQVLNVSEVQELVNLRDQNLINEYFNAKLNDVDLVFDQKLKFVGLITGSTTTTQLLQQAESVNIEGRLFIGNFWIVDIPKYDQINIQNVEDNPNYDVRDEDGVLADIGEYVQLNNRDWVIYTNEKEFQKIALNQAVDYNVAVRQDLSNAVGQLTQAGVNRQFDKAITRNTIKTIKDQPTADTNGETNNLWFEIIDEN